ncbi:uncharacterized protein [Argopecten irradians]|uniref:uncharacterized protein n=1 Tax=Argopecten irradians TaxID=31199 RepID=UPI003712504B
MYAWKALIWLILAAYVFIISTGNKTAEKSDVIYHYTKSDVDTTPKSDVIHHYTKSVVDTTPKSSSWKALSPTNYSEKEKTTKILWCGACEKQLKMNLPRTYKIKISNKQTYFFSRRRRIKRTQRSNKPIIAGVKNTTFPTNRVHEIKTDNSNRQSLEVNKKRNINRVWNMTNLSGGTRNNSGGTRNNSGGTRNNSGETRNNNSSVNVRKRRYAYDDNDEWQYDEKFDYDEDSEETKKWKKYAKNWDKIGLRLIYIGSTIIMVTCLCCLCCRKCCRIVCSAVNHCVMSCVDRCLCRDPS